MLERVTKLVALSSSDRIEEARTASYLACKLIRENGFVVTDRQFPPHAAPKPAAKQPQAARTVIRSRYTSYCRTCGTAIREGARVAWAPGRGAICIECHREERRAG